MAAAPLMVVCPQVLPPNASAAQIDRNTQIRRAHPLYADVSLRLLTEIMNSRLFTTVGFHVAALILPLLPDTTLRLLTDNMHIWLLSMVAFQPGPVAALPRI